MDHIPDSGPPLQDEDIAKWEADFNQYMDTQRDELNYGDAMQDAWERDLGDYSHMPVPKVDERGYPDLGDYVFGVSLIVYFTWRSSVCRAR